MAKVIRSCHRLTWLQKEPDQKERGFIETNCVSCSDEFSAKIFCSLVKRRVKN